MTTNELMVAVTNLVLRAVNEHGFVSPFNW